MTPKPTGPRINLWKWLFLLLLAANLAFIAVLANRLIDKRETDLPQVVKANSAEGLLIGRFETNRDQLNQTLTTYLKPYQTKQLSYQVIVGNSTILFEGNYRLLGYDVPLYIYLTPHKLEDGQVQLLVTDFSVGTLSLPTADVLRYVRASYKLPNFVSISPNEGSILIDLTKLDNKAGFYAKATQIDLLNDQISFNLYQKVRTN